MKLKQTGKTETTVYEFRYKISSECSWLFKIHFVNGAFHRCEFPFNGIYDREQWKALAAVEAKISEIEGEIAKEIGHK